MVVKNIIKKWGFENLPPARVFPDSFLKQVSQWGKMYAAVLESTLAVPA